MFEIIAKIITRNLKNIANSKNSAEKNKQIFQIILWSGVSIVSFITYAPRDLSFSQVILSIVSFLLIVYFAIRTLKYFKII